MAAAERIEFTGSLGETLSARLERPAGTPRGYAVFAHCFSCSKDVFAASRISQGLAGRGFAVMRFDFTGLGHSDGDFSNTSFSSNVEDLIEAARFLERSYQAPTLLVGHSLGGAAALLAALQLPSVKAVATIGAPADTEHVTGNFIEHVPEIEAKGEAQVHLAGRPFTIRRQFLDDLKAHKVTDGAAQLKRPLLILHAPLDAQVGIDNATALFVAAKHPKSFVSLDKADHLVTNRDDAAYAADVIASWAGRYAANGETERPLPATGAHEVVVQEAGLGTYDAHLASGPHLLMGDQPKTSGGQGLGPNPYEYLAMSLGLCTTQTIRMYADRKGVALSRVTVRVKYDKVYAEDCEGCVEGRGRKVLTLWREILLEGELDDNQRQRMLEIADRCPVHKSLQEKTPIHSSLVDT